MNTEEHPIYSGADGWIHLQKMVNKFINAGIFILVDENTGLHCLPVLKEKCAGLQEACIILLQSSESNKTISTVEQVWRKLISSNAIRNSLLICLGGGVITDIGGFAAASYKRGMNFIHIPTTLLAMVDASLGGKTGVNLDSIKNQIGVFAPPNAVFIFTQFLGTLPVRQKLSGYAEMLKHALIDSENHFNKLSLLDSPVDGLDEKIILDSVAVKMSVVKIDPTEKGLRKALNFGHTIGHAIETYSQKHDSVPLLHGEAIAIGLICESFISMELLELDEKDLERITNLICKTYPHYKIKTGAAEELFSYMHQDKKNSEKSQLNFSLINKIGEPLWDQILDEKLVRESLHFYAQLEPGLIL